MNYGTVANNWQCTQTLGIAKCSLWGIALSAKILGQHIELWRSLWEKAPELIDLRLVWIRL